MTDRLYSVRSWSRTAKERLARLLSKSLASRGRITYRYLDAAEFAALSRNSPVDQRSISRQRSRLRSGKILDLNDRFICECLLHDRSRSGLGLKLMRNYVLPRVFRLHDDVTGGAHVVVVVWRKNTTLGVRIGLNHDIPAIRQSMRAALRDRYYAIVD